VRAIACYVTSDFKPKRLRAYRVPESYKREKRHTPELPWKTHPFETAAEEYLPNDVSAAFGSMTQRIFTELPTARPAAIKNSVRVCTPSCARHYTLSVC